MSEERRFGHHDYKRVRRAHANLAGLDQQQCEAVLSLLLTERDAAREEGIAQRALYEAVVAAAQAFSDVSLVPSAGDPTIGVPNSAEHQALCEALAALAATNPQQRRES